MVSKALEVLAILSYHPVVREALIAHDVIVFVRLFKKYVMSRNGANRDLLLEIFSSIVKQEPVLAHISNHSTYRSKYIFNRKGSD